ncbi:MAG TPA: prepilin-type N-terminal cleavage/methylation domain-containing protein [Stellaceae bacterium]|nr:prepilin-type N-terminal cleavage/methylation domain-containing protein [Stellaceae bacterium]
MPRERGFTLLEVLVAFTIAALAFVVLFKTAGAGLVAARTAGRYEEAVSRARSHLDAIGTNIHATEGPLTGDDGGGYHWRLAVAPGATTRPSPDDSGDEGARPTPPVPISLYDVAVTITWTEGGRSREVTLHTQRLAQAPAGTP